MDVVHFGSGGIWPVVELKMAGKTVRFLLDTGANLFAVSRAFADAHRLPRDGRVDVKLIVGSIVADVVGLPELDFGGATIPAQSAAILEFLDEANEKYGCRVDGVIGTNLFSHAIVRWNYLDGWAEIRPASNPVQDAGFTHGIAHRRHTTTWIMADVGGIGRSKLVLLDTGFSGTISAATTSSTALSVSNLQEFRIVDHAEGAAGVALLPTLSFAGATFREVPLALEIYDPDVPDVTTKLGSGVFQHTELIIDFARGRIAVRKGAGHERKAGYWGLRVERQRSALRVTFLAVGGPAGMSGLAMDDVVQTVDGQPAPERACELYRLLSERSEVTLGVARDNKVLRFSMARAQYLPIAKFR